MEVNFNKIKPSIKKYIKEYYALKDSNTKNIKLTYYNKSYDKGYTFNIISVLREYINNILVEYQLKSMKVKDITSKNLINILNVDSSTDIDCVDIKNKKLIGRGSNGSVYKLDASTLVKIININTLYSYNNNTDKLKEIIDSEYNIAKKAGDIGVGPKVYNHFICKSDSGYYHIIYMENIKNSTTLTSWLEKKTNQKNKEELLNKIKIKLRKLHDNNIIHRDMWSDNILVVKKKNNFDIVIIDYGFAQVQDNILKLEKNREYNSLKYLINNNINIYNFIIDKLLENKELKIYL